MVKFECLLNGLFCFKDNIGFDCVVFDCVMLFKYGVDLFWIEIEKFYVG